MKTYIESLVDPLGYHFNDPFLIVNKVGGKLVYRHKEYVMGYLSHFPVDDKCVFALPRPPHFFGIFDIGTSQIVVPAIYCDAQIINFGNKNYFYLVQDHFGWGLLDKDGNQKLPSQYDYIFPIGDDFVCVSHSRKCWEIYKTSTDSIYISYPHDGHSLSSVAKIGSRYYIASHRSPQKNIVYQISENRWVKEKAFLPQYVHLLPGGTCTRKKEEHPVVILGTEKGKFTYFDLQEEKPLFINYDTKEALMFWTSFPVSDNKVVATDSFIGDEYYIFDAATGRKITTLPRINFIETEIHDSMLFYSTTDKKNCWGIFENNYFRIIDKNFAMPMGQTLVGTLPSLQTPYPHIYLKPLVGCSQHGFFYYMALVNTKERKLSINPEPYAFMTFDPRDKCFWAMPQSLRYSKLPYFKMVKIDNTGHSFLLTKEQEAMQGIVR